MLQAERWIARELRQWLKLLAYDPLRKALGMTDADEDDADDDTVLSLPELMVPIRLWLPFESMMKPLYQKKWGMVVL